MTAIGTALDSAAAFTPGQRKLVAKICAVIQDIGDPRPEGNNKHFKYAYYKDTQIAEWYRLRFANRNILFVPDVIHWSVVEGSTSKGGSTWLTTIQYRFTLIDGETGETITGGAVGQGDDPGDKGANKAFTGAVKFFLMKLALIGGEAEAEDDEQGDRRSDERAVGDRAPYADERRDDDEPIVIGDSHIEGIKRGGRALMATEAQIKDVRVTARDLEATPSKIAIYLEDLDLPTLDLPDDPADRGPALIDHLEKLTSEQIGVLITDLHDRLSRRRAKDDGAENRGPDDRG